MIKKIFFLGLILISCKSDIDNKVSIKGFWKFTISDNSVTNKSKDYFFGEIKDSTFVFWHKNVGYLPPYRYWINNDSIFVKSISTAVQKGIKDSSLAYFGKLMNHKEKMEFYIYNEEEKYHFLGSNKQRFMEEIKEIWIEDNY